MRVLAFLFLGLVLTSCATEEYRAVEVGCRQKYLAEIPPRMENRRVTKYRTERRQTGVIDCRPAAPGVALPPNAGAYRDRGSGAICVPETRAVQVPYTVWEDVDVNRGYRNDRIRACAQALCIERMGNPDCRPG